MSKVLLVDGLSGIGKSTVLEEAMRRSNEEYKLVNYGDRMLEIARHEGLVEERDELRTLDAETQKRIQTRAVEVIVENAAETDTVAVQDITANSVGRFRKWTTLHLVLDAHAQSLVERLRVYWGVDRQTVTDQVRHAHRALPHLRHFIVYATRP